MKKLDLFLFTEKGKFRFEIFDLGTEDNVDIDNLENLTNETIDKLPKIEKLKEKGCGGY